MPHPQNPFLPQIALCFKNRTLFYNLTSQIKGMAKKKKAEKHIHSKTVKPKITPPPNWHLPFILIITLLVYIPALNSGFVNWDDGDYVGENKLVKDISRLPELLTAPVQGNYHPVTMLSLAINYLISGDNAWSYHLFNLIFHLINCFLVYRLVLLLSKNNPVIAFVTSLLFGIHPMHVESVAWVSERKDVLYGLFFLAGHITFTRYVDSGSKKYYWLTFLLAVLSLLSKPAAVIFPVSLFCIDLLRSRKFSFNLVTEKIPFLIPAVIIGILTMQAQKETGATGEEYFGLAKNILFGFYGIMMYFVKMILPLKQSAFYPFPPINENLSAEYYLSPLFSVLLVILFFYGLKKHRFLSFGISFYIINLLLVLQVFSVGSAVIAERYTYIPYLGMFYIAGHFIDQLGKTSLSKAYSVIIPIALLFSLKTFLQAQTWKDGATLWDSVIKNYPCSRAYSSRAALYKQENQIPMAIAFYSEAIRLNAADHESYNNLGNIYTNLNKFDSAFVNYKNSLKVKPDYYVALDNLGSLFARLNQFDSAIFYLNKALLLKPDYKPAISNRGVTLMAMQRYEESIKDWENWLRFEPDDAIVYNTIGLCYQKMGQNDKAIPYYDKAIKINPLGVYFLNRSYSHFGLNNTAQARSDAQAAKQAGANVPENYLQSLGIK